MNEDKKVFEKFTNLYSLSKTLRFELKPIGKTLENMKSKIGYGKNSYGFDTFLADQNIEDAYQILKSVFDRLHENFITESLESTEAKRIDFTSYFEIKEELLKINRKEDRKEFDRYDKMLADEERDLRRAITKLYAVAGEKFKNRAGKEKSKDILKESGYKVLTEAGILKYIQNNIVEIVGWELKTPNGFLVDEEKLKKALEDMNKFFTYFSGFNQNRENYYSADDKATSVSNRIIGDNLPKFVDNIFSFEKNRDNYLGAFNFLKSKEKDLKLKNPKFGKEMEDEFLDAWKIDAEFFAINFFVNCFSQEEINKYNLQIANANYLINLYNQNKTDEMPKLSFFKILYKQIGCGEKKDFIKEIKDNNELKSILKDAKIEGEKYFVEKEGEEQKTVFSFCKYLLGLESYENIYWSDKAINTISGKYFSSWEILKEKLKDAKVFKNEKGEIKIPQAIMLSDLFTVLNMAIGVNEENEKWRERGVFFKQSLFEKGNEEKAEIIQKASCPSEALLRMICVDMKNLAEKFVNDSEKILHISEVDYQKDENKFVIKNWLDSALYCSQILKYFRVKARFQIDGNFQNYLDDLKIGEVIENYDVIRNYLTKKPQSELNKLKLNFENGTLAGGWDENKELENFCVILQDENKRNFLAILTKENRKVFESKGKNKNQIFSNDGSGWRKMVYKLLPGPNKMLPKVLLPKKDRCKFGATEEILDIYSEGGFKKNEATFSKEKLGKIIDFYKKGLEVYPSPENSWQSLFGFKFRDTADYNGVDEFYGDVEKQGYSLNFVDINKEKLDELVDEGKIYLFQICNKDFNLKDGLEKSGNKNLHTIYWQAVFSGLENAPKLSGGAEIFYRPALKKGDIKFATKKDEADNEIDVVLKNGKKAIKHFRFSKEKFVFHCPITLNFCLKNNRINNFINKNLVENRDNVSFIGIDRGEKHLAYYSVVDKNGEILEQGSFNKIKDETSGKETDYAEKLEKMAGNRDESRKNWTTIGTIKEMKEGYISQVVRKIVDLTIKHNAYVVLENLNSGFKNSRKKIEKQIYQKLELALAKKLNFVVDKKAKEGEIMSVQKALQLTPPVNNFGDIEKASQYGIMLYTRANYTSQTDPITGWRKTIYLQKGSEEKIKEQILNAFDDFGFDGKDYYFDYTTKYKEGNKIIEGKKWRLYSGKDGKSLDRFRNESVYENSEKIWKTVSKDVVKILDKLFEGFDKDSGESLFQQIKNGKQLNKIDEYPAWESFRFAIDLIQQIRNSGPKDKDGNPTKDDDFILSPVRDENNSHFDSREGGAIISNGDANGAYNIARKGMMMFERIKEFEKMSETEKKKKKYPDIFIGDKEWDKFAQK